MLIYRLTSNSYTSLCSSWIVLFLYECIYILATTPLHQVYFIKYCAVMLSNWALTLRRATTVK